MKNNILKSIFVTILLLLGASHAAWGTWYISGADGLVGCGWCATGDQGKMSGSPASVTFKSIPAGNYEFKLTKDGNYSGTDCIASTSGVITKSGAQNNNMYIETSATADITFTMTDEANWKFSINAVASAEDYVVAGNGSGKSDWVNGKDWSNGDDSNKMAYADGVWSKTYTNVAVHNDLQFKLCKKGSWNNAIGYNDSYNSCSNVTLSNSGGNIKFTTTTLSTVL